MNHVYAASPDGALSFLFGICSLLVWYTSVTDPSAALLFNAAVLWVILSFGMLAASFLNMARGKMRGNINLLASLLLGLFPGVNALLGLVPGLDYHPVVLGIIYLVGSVFLFAIGIRRLDRPAYRSLGTFSLALGFLLLGLGDLVRQAWLAKAGAWFCFGFALTIFYYGLSVMYFQMGKRLFQGPVLVHRGDWTNMAYGLGEEKMRTVHSGFAGFQDPAILLSFISVVFGLLNFVSAIFSFSLDDELAMGVVRLLLGLVHFCAALVILFQGNPYGNITLISAVCFALFSGSRKVLGVLSAVLYPGLYGLLQLFAGVYILLLVPAMEKKLVYGLMGGGLVLFGLSELTGIGGCSLLAGWLFLGFALIHLYRGGRAIITQPAEK